MNQIEKYLPTNCFTIDHSGVAKEGIVLSMDRGPNHLRPWEPHITVGGWHINRDRINGCVYTIGHGGTFATVFRAQAKKVERPGKRTHYTLVKPAANPVGALFRVSTKVQNLKSLVANGRELRLFTGASGGVVIEHNGHDVLIEVQNGSPLSVFYEDGMVRKFAFDGTSIREEHLTNNEMLSERIAHAWEEMERATLIDDGGRQERVFKAILFGVLDLLQLSTVFDRETGMGMRLCILREFFLDLSPEVFPLVEKSLAAVLYQIEPSLVPIMYGNEDDGLPDGVASIAVAREKRDRAKEEAAKAARRAERLALQPKKGPGGQKQVRASNPDMIARRGRKAAQRK